MHEIPTRQIRAAHTETTITVYQAYPPEIADAALAAGTFAAPFKRERMTWIKPSFLWMAYRCGWGQKPGQERVLAVTITREGFAWALGHAALSHYVPGFHADERAWQTAMRNSPVRVQWDPERDLCHRPLPHRSLQVGLSGEAVDRYVGSWITGIQEVTSTMHAIRTHLADGNLAEAERLLPSEPVYPLDTELAAAIGADA